MEHTDKYSLLDVRSHFGVCTARHLSCIPLHEHIPFVNEDDSSRHFTVDVPLGSNIVRWDMKTKLKSKSFRAHTDLITCVIKHFSLEKTRICTTSHGGEVALWDSNWNLISRTKVSAQKVMHASFSFDGKRVLTTSLFQKGLITIIDILHDDKLHVSKEIRNGIHHFVEWTPDGNLIGIKENEAKQFVEVVLYKSSDGSVIKQIELPGKYATGVAVNQKGLIAVARSRSITVIDLNTLDIVWTMETPGSGYIKAFVFHGEELLIPSDNGNMTLWLRDKLERTIRVPSGPVYFMHFNKEKQRIWFTNESGLHYIAFDDKIDTTDYELSFHGMTCCGVDTFENMVVAGDFSGNVMIWKDQHASPFKVNNIENSVRSVCWKPDGGIVLIGDMSGDIHEWKYEENVLRKVHQLKGQITCIKWENSSSPERFAASTSDGRLGILKYDKINNNYQEILSYQAHPPIGGPQDLKFGTIQKFAEIWSLSWSPDNSHIATSSEDQTTKIWTIDGKEVAVLRGHTAAVTSVDWTSTVVGELLATCADDKTVRLYNPKNWELIHVFLTTEVEECMENGGNRLAVATQSGYIFVWNLETKEKLFGEKMHAGSIEGLRWNHKTGIIVSCASDCTVSMFSVISKL